MSLIATLAEEELWFRAAVECESLWKISEFTRPIEDSETSRGSFRTSRTENYQVPVLATGEIHAFAGEIGRNLIGIRRGRVCEELINLDRTYQNKLGLDAMGYNISISLS